MAGQVTQVYYLPYAFKKREDLNELWVVHEVTPHGCIRPYYCSAESSFAEGSSQDVSFYQEEGLDGTFVIFHVILS